MNDNEPPSINMPESLHPDFGDPMQLLAMRDWLEKAITKAGAKVGGAGIGMGGADLEFQLEGHMFSVSIYPILKEQP